MTRLAAELLLLVGLLILTVHITVLWSTPFQHGNATSSSKQNTPRIADNVNEDSLPSELHPEQQTVPQATRGSPVLQTDKSGAFLLDLHNFPDLSKADINKQNPNIQVTIEVLNSPEGLEAEKKQHKESKSNVAFPGWRSWWTRSSSSTSASHFPGSPRSETRNTEPFGGDSMSPPGGRGRYDTRGGQKRHSQGTAQEEFDYTDGEGGWSAWSACSVSCGNGSQKRTRSCGYGCTATESRTCDMLSCPGIEDAFRTAATEVSLLAGTDDFNATELFSVATDSCERWMNCKSEFLRKYMLKVSSDLPSCPCSYPTEAAYGSTNVHDSATGRDFRWKDASGPKEKLPIYKPTARYCIRSSLTLQSTTLAAQHCCYDDDMALITRGKGAGSPNLISTEFSEDLHYKVDILPWVICKGDWSRYNQARPPNNRQRCGENPVEEDYRKQCEEARDF
ncbi:isthmin-1-like [Paramormyrops kingsleyae]|uniref:isthmin-1-like n=1 Tax=Paramormyrops kingsleyae TaxID=1676925 RepID=UPI003B9711EB